MELDKEKIQKRIETIKEVLSAPPEEMTKGAWELALESELQRLEELLRFEKTVIRSDPYGAARGGSMKGVKGGAGG